MQQIMNWFNNRGIGCSQRRGGTTIVIGTGSAGRSLSAKELYSKENYTTKIQPRIALIVKQENTSQDKCLAVISRCTSEAWNAESKEVQKQYEVSAAAKRKEKEAIQKWIRLLKSAPQKNMQRTFFVGNIFIILTSQTYH